MKSTLKPVLAMETLNVSKKVMVQNAQGLHARPADLFVKTATVSYTHLTLPTICSV